MIKRKTTLILSFIGVLVVVSFMALATYAYFTLEIIGEGTDMNITAFNETMEITYVDTSNVTMVNAYTGDSITKTFTVENTGDTAVYYNIVLEDLVNNFANPDDLVYTLTGTNDGAIVNTSTIPTRENASIASNILINPGVQHSYTMNITFLKTDEDQNSNMNKTFSSNINVLPSLSKQFSTGTLANKMITDNVVTSSASLDYKAIPSANGVYYTNSSIDGSTVYFFRGNTALNNNVIFGGFCWKIIRTTEDGGVRLIYNGTHTDGTCVNTTTGTMLDTNSAFNTNANYNAYVGYMYGTPNSATYELEHANTNSSAIKTVLDTWYVASLSSYSSYLLDSVYCNNRKTDVFTISSVVYGKSGFRNVNTGYNSMKRINVESDSIPSYNCSNVKDRFTVSNTNGNTSLANPIGLITSDEAVFAGYTKSTANTTSFLYNANNYWTMTPSYFNGSNAYNYVISNGSLNQATSSTSYGIRPVITINKTILVISGDGSTSTPYLLTAIN